MSFAALAAIRGVEVPGPSALLLLFILAEYAGDDGCCFPSQATLVERSWLSIRAVRDNLGLLEDWHLIEQQRRNRKDGTRTSNQIRLLYYIPEQQAESAACGEAHRQNGVAPKRQNPPRQPAAGADPTTFEPVTEHITSPRKRELDAAFEAWWEIYPRKAEKRAARQLFDVAVRRHGASFEDLNSAAQSYAIEVHGRDPAMVKQPTTWLQRQCWLPETEAAVPSPPKGFPSPEFDLPPEVVSDLFAAAPDVGVCLHGATWREEDRTIVTVRRWGADELMKRVGPVRLRALGLRAEAAAGGR